MTEHLAGIDLNGLCDVSIDLVDSRVLRGGDVPSVVVLRPRDNDGPLQVIAGVEAAMAVEGRGWHWPRSAQVRDGRQNLRVPLLHILRALVDDNKIEAAGETLSPIELLAEALDGLSRPKGSVAAREERTAVITVPDDGCFQEEARQRLIDAAKRGGLMPTLLWRPVAALLGLDPTFDSRTARKLSGRAIGVLSCLDDGVHAARLEIEVRTDDDGESYFVPIRREAGIVVPYRKSISVLAEEVAKRHAPSDDPQDGWQLLWGGGLALRWLLRLKTADTVIQTRDGWRLVAGQRPPDLPQVEFDDAALDELADYLSGIHHSLFEGPALETMANGTRLVYFLKDRVTAGVHTLRIATQSQHLAAHGCVVYLRRRAQNRITYFDHLPQLRLAVRRGTNPSFLDLIETEARVEGGTTYKIERDLGLSVQPGTTALNFYLLREGRAKPRYLQVDLVERVSTSVPVHLRIRQQPAQGTARLTLVSASADISFRPVEVHWERMTEEDIDEDEVLDRLRIKEKPAEVPPVPPVQPQPYHALLWTSNLGEVGGSLVDLVPHLVGALDQDNPSPEEIANLLRQHSVLLTRRAPPIVLTRGLVRDRTLYRAVSSDGDLPEPEGELSHHLLELFANCLNRLDEMTFGADASLRSIRSASVRMAGWCFLRCPDGLRRHLLDVARHGRVPDSRIYFRAMGKVFAGKAEYQAFFALLERRLTAGGAKFKLNEIEGFFYLLSLREDAPLALSNDQAMMFACKLLDRIDECVGSRNRLSRLVTVSLKACASLIRYRLVRPDFITIEDPMLGERQPRVLQALLARSRRDGRVQIARLTERLIEWTKEYGTDPDGADPDPSILQWDEDDENEDE